MKKIVVATDAVSGELELYGPFEDEASARKWAEVYTDSYDVEDEDDS